MIIKPFELLKTNLKDISFLLLYGANEGHKKEIMSNTLT